MKLISIIIRTYNEANYISQCLESLSCQTYDKNKYKFEILIIDSDSTDSTITLSTEYNCKIVRIKKEDFSFGRALNLAILESSGEIIVALSAHCIPYSRHWLEELVSPLDSELVPMTYGRQIGTHTSRFSELQIFKKNYPEYAYEVKNRHFFTGFNNANSAFRRKHWERFKFDETLTGLEDLKFALRVYNSYGLKPVYCPSAIVFHSHIESNQVVYKRFYREKIAYLKFADNPFLTSFSIFTTSFFKNVIDDLVAMWPSVSVSKIRSVIGYRFYQFFGEYRASKVHIKEQNEENRTTYI